MKKKSFALLTTLFLLIIFSYLSINIVQNRTYKNQINIHKYMYIQALIHIKYIKKHILNTPIDIKDDRFILKIIKDINNTNTTYHIYLKSKKDLNAHISMYEKVIK